MIDFKRKNNTILNSENIAIQKPVVFPFQNVQSNDSTEGNEQPIQPQINNDEQQDTPGIYDGGELFSPDPDSNRDIRTDVSIDDFKNLSDERIREQSFTYVIPIASTDYKGIENLDPRLADRIWRLENLYTVINEDGELVRFKLRDAQKKLLMELHYKNIILKARQLGFTTFICIFMLDYALFNSNKQLGIVGPTQVDTAVIFRKIKVAWENFPAELKESLFINTRGDSKTEYEFSNGSIMRVSTSLRSGTYQAILITEFGKISAKFPEKAEEIITGTLPAVPAKGLVFIESTAEGEDGRFFEMVTDAMELDRVRATLTIKDYKFFFFPWYQNPANWVPGDLLIPNDIVEYLDKVSALTKVTIHKEQRNWYFLEQKVQKGKMKQEHPSTPDEAFLTSGNKLFSSDSIQRQLDQFACEQIRQDGDFIFYKEYRKGHMYGLGADVSQGKKRDSSTIVVIDFTTGEVVMTYRSNEVDPVNFAYDIKKAAIWYGGCVAAPEANSVGQTTCVTLHNIYPNVYTQYREGELELKSTSKLGWLTTGLSKPRMMYELSEAVDEELVKLLDIGIIREAKKFNKEDSLEVETAKSKEEVTRHFDLLMATAIAWQMRAHLTRGLADEEEVRRAEDRRQERTVQHKRKYN